MNTKSRIDSEEQDCFSEETKEYVDFKHYFSAVKDKPKKKKKKAKRNE